jgi:hypothetical protein
MPGSYNVILRDATHHLLVACLVEDEPAHQGVGQGCTQQQADPVGGVVEPGATAAWGVAACRGWGWGWGGGLQRGRRRETVKVACDVSFRVCLCREDCMRHSSLAGPVPQGDHHQKQGHVAEAVGLWSHITYVKICAGSAVHATMQSGTLLQSVLSIT